MGEIKIRTWRDEITIHRTSSDRDGNNVGVDVQGIQFQLQGSDLGDNSPTVVNLTGNVVTASRTDNGPIDISINGTTPLTAFIGDATGEAQPSFDPPLDVSPIVFNGTRFDAWNNWQTLQSSQELEPDVESFGSKIQLDVVGFYKVTLQGRIDNPQPGGSGKWPTGETMYGTQVDFTIFGATQMAKKSAHTRYLASESDSNSVVWTDVYLAQVVDVPILLDVSMYANNADHPAVTATPSIAILVERLYFPPPPV